MTYSECTSGNCGEWYYDDANVTDQLLKAAEEDALIRALWEENRVLREENRLLREEVQTLKARGQSPAGAQRYTHEQKATAR